MEQETTATVTIHQQTYRVRCQDPARVEQLANYLDQRMREIASQTTTVDSLKVAVLTALNIVEDFFTVREELDGLKNRVERQAGEMAQQLEAVNSSP